MKYRRIKTLDSTGVPVMRYYKLADGEEALCNCFYFVKKDGTKYLAEKIEGTLGEGTGLIGFSLGGDNLAKGCILLDINKTPLYMGIFEEDEEARPVVGDLVNGYQRVVFTHYENEDATAADDFGFTVDDMDLPYYIFHIEQPEATGEVEADDEGAGEQSGNPGGEGGTTPAAETVVISFNTLGGTPFPPAQVIKKGGKVEKPTDPEDAHGGTFVGWYIASEEADEPEVLDLDTATFDTDTTLTALYEN